MPESDLNTVETVPAEQQQRVAAIISRGQRRRPGAVSSALHLGCSAILLWAAFPPLNWSPLAWVALVPMLQLARPGIRTQWLYRITGVVGFLYWLIELQWMRLGDVTMYGALLALSAYLALYWMAFLALLRGAVQRLKLPLVVAAPLLWVGLEYLRAHLLTGFAWYYLGHSQYRWIELIQISDLGGAYAVSFVVVLANAALAQLVSRDWLMQRGLCRTDEAETLWTASAKLRWTGLATALGILVLACGYGHMRRGHEPFPVGPRVALIQGNFVATVRNDQHEPREIFMSHRQLTGMVVGERPDVVVWPEGMFPYGIFLAEQGITDDQLQKTSPDVPVNLWRNEEAQQALSDLTDMTNAAMIVGAAVYTAGPLEYALYNSAVFLQPGIGLVNRYDKIHRVPFGEYIPLHDMLPFLQKFTPFRGQFGIDRGKEAHVFRYRDWQLIPIICFEDTVPHLVRRIASVAGINGAEQSQCLVNLTNDGWFHGSSALDQHLITSLFRAVEVRAPLVRAVNTGISAVIDGDGVIRDPDVFFEGVTSKGSSERVQSFRDPKTGRFHKQISCALVADVPLDPRTSLYVMIGDTFALLCLTASVAILLSSLFLRPAPVRSGPESLVPPA